MNTDIIRCYFKTILQTPNQPYRKEFYRNWIILYPENQLTEQRICDQKREITRRANGNINVRGNWLTNFEINQIQTEITQQLRPENEDRNINGEGNAEPVEDLPIQVENDAINAEELAHNNPRQRGDEEQNAELQRVKDTLLNQLAESVLTPFENRHDLRKPGRKIEKQLEKALGMVNEVVEDVTQLTEISDVTQLNHLVYASAITAIKISNLDKECIIRKAPKNKNNNNDWEFRMTRKINELRADISKLSQMNTPNKSSKMKQNSNAMKNKYKINKEDDRVLALEKSKQRLYALNNRLSRYKKRQKQFRQNNEFFNKPNKLYDDMRGNKITVTNPPTKEQVETFWRPMYETKKQFNKNASWLKEYRTSTENIIPANYTSITPAEMSKSSSKFSNWKSPGIDKLQNYWWTKLTNIHTLTAKIFDDILKHPDTCPEWLTTGRTTLVPKKVDTQNPSNYRPITCLPVVYKILTSIITTRMNHHIQANNIMPEEQKGNSSNTYGTIDQLLINKMVMEEAKQKKRNISTAWIDYRKAFDSIPHDWMIETLRIHKFDDTTIKFFETTMANWKTSLTLNYGDDSINTDMFSINTGIFQGDSPSGLIFILCLLPLSWLLKESKLGYRLSRIPLLIISHLLFMDDLKIYASNDKQLESMLNIVKTFSDDIKMTFGFDKCYKLTIIRGKIIGPQNIILNTGEELKSLEHDQQYRYLGVNERQTTDKTMKTSLKKEYFARVKMILKSELNSKNAISAINSFAVPSLAYGFPVLDWTISDLEIIDRETRKMLQTYHLMHSQSDVTRIYLPRREGGRGLINVTSHYKNAIINFSAYLVSSEDSFLQTSSNWQLTRGEKSIHQRSQTYCGEINSDVNEMTELSKQQRKAKIKTARITKLKEELLHKNTHGQFCRHLDQPQIDQRASNQWLRSASLKRTTESMICAVQEQAISTKYIQKNVFKTVNDDQCRLCKEAPETIHHVISGCTMMAPTKYLQRQRM